jgi:hypothetical protein
MRTRLPILSVTLFDRNPLDQFLRLANPSLISLDGHPQTTLVE